MKSILLFVCFMATQVLYAQNRISQEEYIELYKNMAIRKMHQYGIPASITLAQGILESASGNSQLAKNARNHFGIKCHKDWTGSGYYMDDDEANECFRVYDSAEGSYADHSEFLSKRARYKFLFTDFEVTDYKGWAKGLKKAGYATNPKYPQLLIAIIEKNGLDKYDTSPFPADVDETYLAGSEQTPNVQADQDTETGVFTFNRADVVLSNGETDRELAIRYNIDEARLRKYNDRYMGEPIKKGQKVYLQPKRRRGAQPKHTVQPGESLWQISQMQGIRLAKLLKRNNLSVGDEVAPGQVLYLRRKNPNTLKLITWQEVEEMRKTELSPVVKPQSEESKSPSKPKETTSKTDPSAEVLRPDTHVVQAGETLYGISMLYYLTVQELKEKNGLTSNTISVGQTLKIKD